MPIRKAGKKASSKENMTTGKNPRCGQASLSDIEGNYEKMRTTFEGKSGKRTKTSHECDVSKMRGVATNYAPRAKLFMRKINVSKRAASHSRVLPNYMLGGAPA